MTNLADPIFTDEEAARKHLEKVRWPEGPYCPKCGQFDTVKELGGKSMGPGWYHCGYCRDKFTVRTGSIFERSHLPLHKWVMGFHLMASSKKGISAHQLHRMLGVQYKTAWFMAHRIREAMKDTDPTPLGGKDKIVEADDTYQGNIAGRHRARSPKGYPSGDAYKVVTLVERGGKARSVLVPALTANSVRAVVLKNADLKSDLMTDEGNVYIEVGKKFATHRTIKHSEKEYVRGLVSTNTVEGFFSIFKRGMRGVYQHCSEQHLHRYLTEFDFRYSHRVALGYGDDARALRAIKGAAGKRLRYQGTD
jgi:transposase-like protein